MESWDSGISGEKIYSVIGFVGRCVGFYWGLTWELCDSGMWHFFSLKKCLPWLFGFFAGVRHKMNTWPSGVGAMKFRGFSSLGLTLSSSSLDAATNPGSAEGSTVAKGFSRAAEATAEAAAVGLGQKASIAACLAARAAVAVATALESASSMQITDFTMASNVPRWEENDLISRKIQGKEGVWTVALARKRLREQQKKSLLTASSPQMAKTNSGSNFVSTKRRRLRRRRRRLGAPRTTDRIHVNERGGCWAERDIAGVVAQRLSSEQTYEFALSLTLSIGGEARAFSRARGRNARFYRSPFDLSLSPSVHPSASYDPNRGRKVVRG